MRHAAKNRAETCRFVHSDFPAQMFGHVDLLFYLLARSRSCYSLRVIVLFCNIITALDTEPLSTSQLSYFKCY